MLQSSDVIGEGAYGCVHKPQLFCKGEKQQLPNVVSKLMKNKDAKKEFKEYNIIDKADPKNNYYLGIPKNCNPEEDINKEGIYNKESAKKCKNLKKNDSKIIKNLKNYRLMIMENGGDNLEMFANNAKKWNRDVESTKKMELFWLEAHRIFLGLKTFLNNGIIHHDLKPQNIVYNETTKRINFIDFGLMQKKSNIINESKKSKYGFSVNHWSFPLETLFLNKKNYDYITQLSNDDKIKYINNVVEDFKNNKDNDIVNSIRNLLYSVSNSNNKFLNLKKMFVSCLNEYSENILYFFINNPDNYNNFLNLCLNTIDIYGTGIAFLCVLKNTYFHINSKFANDLSKLFLSMINENLSKRINIEQAINLYEQILKNNGILTKYNKHFFKNNLLDGPSLTIKVKKRINSVNINNVNISPIEMKQILKKDNTALDPKKVCSPNKELNPKTNRCIKLCKTGYQRDSNFHCKKNKTAKIPNSNLGPKKCSSDKELNPKTNRCIKLCKTGYQRDSNFHCKKNKTVKNIK